MRTSQEKGRVCREWLIPLAPADQDVVGGGLEGEAEAEQALEGGGGRPAAIEAEDELVEIRLQVLRPQAVIDPERPPLGLSRDWGCESGRRYSRAGFSR